MKKDRSTENAHSQDSNLFPTPLRVKTVLLAVIAMLVALALIPFADKTWWIAHDLLSSSLLEEFLYITAGLVSVTAIVTMLAIIWILDPKRRKAVVVFLIAFSLSSFVNEVVKEVAGRARPHYSIDMSEEQKEKIEKYRTTHPGTAISAERHDEWLLFKTNRPFFEYKYASFPSGHSNNAFVIAAFLTLLYPRARIIWLLLAAGCALDRVKVGAHFLEDVLFGGALGWLVAHWVFSMSWAARLAGWVIKRLPPGMSNDN
jgi:membrane-associated phospholipid phosphatase